MFNIQKIWILYKGNIDDKSFVQIKPRWSEMNN